MRKITTGLLALVLTLGFNASAPQVVAAANDPCIPGIVTNNHIVITKDVHVLETGSESVARDLDPCYWPTPANFFSVWLGANIQEKSSGEIYQLGYGVRAGWSNAHYFVYADGSHDAIWLNIKPTMGTTYSYRIYRDATLHVNFIIRNEDNGQIVWQKWSSNSWPEDNDKVWWGAETQDNGSGEHGIDYGKAKMNAKYMYYKTYSGNYVYLKGSGPSFDLYRSGYAVNQLCKYYDIGQTSSGYIKFDVVSDC